MDIAQSLHYYQVHVYDTKDKKETYTCLREPLGRYETKYVIAKQYGHEVREETDVFVHHGIELTFHILNIFI